MKYILTNESVTVTFDGTTHCVKRGAPNFLALREAIIADDPVRVRRNLTVAGSLVDWAKGRFTVVGDVIRYDGETLPDALNQRIVEMATNGEDPTSLFNFWERLQKNPSKRSVEQLWSFLNNMGIPLTREGMLLAYKSVTHDFKDHRTKSVDNSVGANPKMPRNKISDDPNHGCDYGYHVGALEYASEFGDADRKIVICEVDPANVVCIPYDSSCQKMRVCEYKVIGHHAGDHLSSTSYDEETYDEGSCDVSEEITEAGDSVEQDKIRPKRPRTAAGRRAAQLDAMAVHELMDVKLDELRKYASRDLKIIGAHRIPGGKIALISAIMSVR